MNLRWNPLPGAYLVDAESDDNFDLKLSYVAQRKKRVKDINLDGREIINFSFFICWNIHFFFYLFQFYTIVDAVFDVLQMQLSMRRRMSYHIIQTYIPSAFLVFITWLSFLIPEDLVEARIGGEIFSQFAFKPKVKFGLGRYFNDNVTHTHCHVCCCQVKRNWRFYERLSLAYFSRTTCSNDL